VSTTRKIVEGLFVASATIVLVVIVGVGLFVVVGAARGNL
jgi:hypothetical protein